MSNMKIYSGDIRMSPDEISYLEGLFNNLSGSMEKVVMMVSQHLGKGQTRPTNCTFTISYGAPLYPGDSDPVSEEHTDSSIKVRVSYPDGTHGSLESPPGVSYAS